MDTWFLSRSNMLLARSTTHSRHSGRLPGTFQAGSMPSRISRRRKPVSQGVTSMTRPRERSVSVTWYSAGVWWLQGRTFSNRRRWLRRYRPSGFRTSAPSKRTPWSGWATRQETDAPSVSPLSSSRRDRTPSEPSSPACSHRSSRWTAGLA